MTKHKEALREKINEILAEFDVGQSTNNRIMQAVQEYVEYVIGADGNEKQLRGIGDKALGARLRLEVGERNKLRAEQRKRAGIGG